MSSCGGANEVDRGRSIFASDAMRTLAALRAWAEKRAKLDPWIHFPDGDAPGYSVADHHAIENAKEVLAILDASPAPPSNPVPLPWAVMHVGEAAMWAAEPQRGA